MREGRAAPPGSERTWAIVAGGGTAGHVQPGIDIARALVAGGRAPSSIAFVGTLRGIEARLVPEAGFPLVTLPGRGLVRRLSAANLVSAWGLARAVVKAVVLVARRRPAVVVSLGGYASFACAVAAGLLRVPIVVVEQNAVPGAANRLVGRIARASAVSFPGTELPRAVVTGNPVRPEVLSVDRSRDRAAARRELGLPEERRTLAVFGGSLGARRINVAVVEALPVWAADERLAIRHVVGERDWERLGSSVPPLEEGGVVYQPVRYEDRMAMVLAAADLAVCRAGGTTVAELAVVGLPAVLVPLPGAPGDHQTANARVLQRAGAAVLVPDAELDASRLVSEVNALLDDPLRLEAMSAAATTCGHRDAARQVATVVEEHARRGR